MPAPAPALAPARAAVQSVGVVCPDYRRILIEAGIPREAARAGIDAGEVTVEFVVAMNGEIRDVKVVSSTERLLNRGSMEAVRRLSCEGQARDVRVLLPIRYAPP